ncbi:MAG TPA: prephenate dehydrogenase/arogenate dehydrogenase family protein [Pirellulales bacterium]|nr:prephenate dehydrogenase/arogenate dehydrogenase family protein [Pirellulales bacterium]
MPRWNTVAIIGVGLIGGSIGLALRKKGLAAEIVGIGRPQSGPNLEKAKQLGAITSSVTDMPQGMAAADVVIVCTPVGEIANHILLAAKGSSDQTILTDAGSTKAAIIRKVEAALKPGKRFVGSHPLAGSEKKSVEFARADLFEGRVAIVTPTSRTKAADAKEIADFWSALGSNVLTMSPEIHDLALAGTSHVPHLISAAVAANTPPADLPLTAGGWRDLTRIAAGDPALWTQILLENQAHVLKSLAGFEKKVTAFRTAIERGDAAQLHALLTEGKQVRDALGD